MIYLQQAIKGRGAHPSNSRGNCYRLRVIVVMAVIVMMLGDGLGVALRLEVLLDIGVFLRSLDLIDFERDAQPLRKIAFGDREIPGARVARVEMLVIPVKWRRTPPTPPSIRVVRRPNS